jgi:hypothetical protein
MRQVWRLSQVSPAPGGQASAARHQACPHQVGEAPALEHLVPLSQVRCLSQGGVIKPVKTMSQVRCLSQGWGYRVLLVGAWPRRARRQDHRRHRIAAPRTGTHSGSSTVSSG